MRALRYSFYNGLLVLTFLGFFGGQAWLWLGFVFLLSASVIGDRILPHDRSEVGNADTRVLNALLYSILPLLTLNVGAFIWQMAPGDWLGLGNSIQNFFDINVLERKSERHWFDTLGGGLSLGLLCASAGTNVAHELVHRVWDRKALITGRWLLAYTFDTSFSIEHVYGHHANIATDKDPASARRGEIFFTFLFRSTIQGYISGYRLEADRLRKRKKAVFSLRNRFLRGQLMSLAVVLLYAAAMGWMGVGLCLLVGFYGKAYLELVNYIEHYGLVRVPGTPVEPRHSWNSNHRVSSLFLYNLTRHSHHHARGNLPFWKLEAMPDAPSLPYGYMSMILLALVPPLYQKVMNPLLVDWDQHHASPEEIRLIK